MGFFESLFGKNKTSSGKTEENKVSVMYDTFPDKPQPFAFRNYWLCVKSENPEAVISALGLKNSVSANWESGLSQRKVFVSPCINGYVLVIGYLTMLGGNAETEMNRLRAAAQSFPEMQCFSFQSTVDFYAWAKFVGGELVRSYGWLGESGEIYMNSGAITPEEQELGFDSFIQSDDDDWEAVEFPDEDSVTNIAAAWGVDPWFSEGQYDCGVGYVCDMS